MPEEIYEDGEIIGYDQNAIHKNSGAVVLIEDVLYGDDREDQDYARCGDSSGPFSPLGLSTPV